MHVRNSKHSRRTRSGCLTCRRRHYKCDEKTPRCNRCTRTGHDCVWPGNNAKSGEHVKNSSEAVIEYLDGTNEAANQGKLIIESSSDQYTESETLPMMLANTGTNHLLYYISHFYEYSFYLCNWTCLLELPRRSSIPNLLSSKKKNAKRMTSWANFYLPHLARGTLDDPLSLAMAAYVAIRMRDKFCAVAFYARVLQQLRQLLCRRDAAQLNNQEFMRIWATTLLLARYEDELGNQLVQAQHIEGATTLALIASVRFGINNDTVSSSQQTPLYDSESFLLDSENDQSEANYIDRTPLGQTSSAQIDFDDSMPHTPKNESELPTYLTTLTRRLRHASLICETIDISWPEFRSPTLQESSLEDLLEKSAECYAHVMPLIETFHTELANRFPTTATDRAVLVKHYQAQYQDARRCIDKYEMMFRRMQGPEFEVQTKEAPEFPFSPRIVFASLYMAQPFVMPHIFMVMLAPFLTDTEHSRAVRTATSVLAQLQSTPGSWMNAAWPDVFLAAFWLPGAERDHFVHDIRRRKGDWKLVVDKIWQTIDAITAEQGQRPDSGEILGIVLYEYRQAFLDGFKLQHTPTWQTPGLFQLSWAMSVGLPDPLRSRFSSPEVRERRRQWPTSIHYYQHRIRVYRQNKGHVLNLSSVMEQLVLNARAETKRFEEIDCVNPLLLENYKGPDNFEEYDENKKDEALERTATGKLIRELSMNDVDNNRIFYII